MHRTVIGQFFGIQEGKLVFFSRESGIVMRYTCPVIMNVDTWERDDRMTPVPVSCEGCILRYREREYIDRHLSGKAQQVWF